MVEADILEAMVLIFRLKGYLKLPFGGSYGFGWVDNVYEGWQRKPLLLFINNGCFMQRLRRQTCQQTAEQSRLVVARNKAIKGKLLLFV